MGIDFLSNHHIVSAFPPVADAFAGGIDTDVMDLKNYARATLIIQTGAIEDTAISNLITMKACTDNAKAGATAMAFRYRFGVGSTTDDSWGALTAVTSSGYNFANRSDAAANNMWFLEVTADEVGSALAGAQHVYASIAETVDKTITAGGLWILSEPRFPQSIPLTAIA